MDKSRKRFQNRKFTLKKKAGELATLCKSEVCVVCYDSNGEMDVWPEDPTKAQSIINKYYSKESCHTMKREKAKLNLSAMLEKKIKKLERQVNYNSNNIDKGFSSLPSLWDEDLDTMSKDSLMSLSQCLETKIQILDQKLELLKGKEQLNSQTRISNQFEEQYCSSFPPFPLSQEVVPVLPEYHIAHHQYPTLISDNAMLSTATCSFAGFPVHGLEEWIN